MTRRATPWWLYLPSPLTGTFFGLLGATGPELRAATGVGYGGIAAIFIAQTLGTVGGAAAAGLSRARIFRPRPMALAVAGALALTLAVDDALALLPLMLVAGFGCYAINARAQGDLSIVTGERRARALALFHVFGGLGMATVAPPQGDPAPRKRLGEATTIAIVATDARLTKAEAHRMAVAAQDGMARAIVPSHTLLDGDLVFAAATGRHEMTEPVRDLFQIGHAAATCLARAVARGVYEATAMEGDLQRAWRGRMGEQPINFPTSGS